MQRSEQDVDLVEGRAVVGLSGAALVAALTGALAYVTIPYPPSATDITLQVLGVFVAGLFLGAWWGGLSMLLYVLAGALGAPVFKAGASGLGQVQGPTGGYLVGFVVAAVVIGLLAHGNLGYGDPAGVGIGRLVVALAAGTVVIYGNGIAWMAYVTGMGIERAAVVGGAVFLPAEALKAAAAVGIAKSDRRPEWPPRRVSRRDR